MEPVHRTLSRALLDARISRDVPLLLAVSGGGDSLALLHALVRIGQRVAVAHVHHGARGPAADADLAAVDGAARSLGVAFRASRIQVSAGRPGSWEARARVQRYAALEALRLELRCAWLATAHTLDDQAETVLLRALRGTRLEGLAGTAFVDHRRRLIRPALGLRRAQLREYLQARGIAWRDDETNADLRRARNRLRLQVLPELEALQPRAVEHLAALAEQAALLRAEREQGYAAVLEVLEPGEGGHWLAAGTLLALEPAARRDALCALLGRLCPAHGLRAAHLSRALEFVERARPGQRLSLPGPASLLRDRDAFWLGPRGEPCWPAPLDVALEPGRALQLPERGLRLRWRRVDPGASPRSEPHGAGEPPGSSALLLSDVSSPLRLRSPRAHDRLARGEVTLELKRVLQRTCSLRERRRAVVVASEREVLWVAGLPGICRPRASGARAAWELVAERVSAAAVSC